MRSLTLRGGRLALRSGIVSGDLQIVDGRIARVGGVPDDLGEVVSARGLLVMPGVIDPQVHFREPGLTHKEDIGSGSRACAAGGITAFLEMPNTDPPTTTLAALAEKKRRAAESSLVHYGFFVGATPDNLEVLRSAAGVPGIKVFMGSSTGSLLVSKRSDLERIFAEGELPIAVHAEDEARLVARKAQFSERTDVAVHSEVRDVEAALRATQLAVELSDSYERRLHILHLSTSDEVDFLRAHGKAGGRITCEVTPQHLLLYAPEIYQRLGTRAQMNPPLRTRSHAEGLWRGLHEGIIDCIATDHAPHTLEEKNRPYGQAPSGMPGVETSLASMVDAAHRGLCSLEQVVEWMTAGPARCYRIASKGEIAVGYDGDLTLVDLGLVSRIDDGPIRTRCGWNPFSGIALTGWPVATIVDGTFVYRDGQIIESTRGRALEFRGTRVP